MSVQEMTGKNRLRIDIFAEYIYRVFVNTVTVVKVRGLSPPAPI